MILGVDYYPEHWHDAMLGSDLDRIVALGANTIRIGEFCWHLLEPKEGTFTFDYFERVLVAAAERNLKVIFGTPTATFPAWLAKKHPDILSRDEKGVVRAFGGRRQYCFNAPTYREYAQRITEKVVEAYAHHPHLIAWQVDNEFGHEGSDACYCDHCQGAFRAYLERTYGTIEAMNEAFGTIFWGQTYNNFSEVDLPKPTITVQNPALQLAHARFRSEAINRFATDMIRAVEGKRRPDQKITHNFFGGFFDLFYDQNPLSAQLDVVGYDHYPVWGGLEEPLSPHHLAMALDYFRGLKGEPFWILEELMGAQGHDIIGYRPLKNQAKLWATQAMLRGCEGMLFFRWRSMTRGQEQFCQGIVDWDDREGEKYEEVKAFFHWVRDQQERIKGQEKGRVAFLYDFSNRWSWKIQRQSAGFDFTNEFLRFYESFHRRNVPVEVIDAKGSFDGYDVLILPVMQLMDEKLQKRIESFVKNGGTVLFTYRTAMKDGENNIPFGPEHHDFLERVAGIEIQGYESLGSLRLVDLKRSERRGTGGVWRDLIRCIDAEALFVYDDIYHDYAAVSVSSRAGGCVYYVGTGVDPMTAGYLAERILKRAKIPYLFSELGVEVFRRGGVTYLLNHNEERARYGKRLLEPFEVACLGEDQ